ncbi:MAG: hypothetical protein E6713_04980 [Sporomusaceae bacterium]|nr:hypothetical protein [Sporomusaceae bacterium]
MDIYTYAGFSYGLTAALSFATVGLILIINKAISKLGGMNSD